MSRALSVLLLLLVGTLCASVTAVCPPQVGDCDIFTYDNEWNRPIHKDPVDYMSQCYVDTQFTSNIHLDLGYGELYGIPWKKVSHKTTMRTITYDGYGDESDAGPMPIPLDETIIEGYPSIDPESRSGGDRHVITVDSKSQRCNLWELFIGSFDTSTNPPDSWIARSGAIWDLTSKNYKRPDTWTSADAAGLPIFPGLLRYEEAATGKINHALRFTIPHAPPAYQYPATHFGSKQDTDYPPYGTRFRLNKEFDETPYENNVAAHAIVKAMKKYGIIFADQGSSMFVSGTSDPGWEDVIDLIHGGAPIPGSAFEAVRSPYPIKDHNWSPGTRKCGTKSVNSPTRWYPTLKGKDYNCKKKASGFVKSVTLKKGKSSDDVKEDRIHFQEVIERVYPQELPFTTTDAESRDYYALFEGNAEGKMDLRVTIKFSHVKNYASKTVKELTVTLSAAVEGGKYNVFVRDQTANKWARVGSVSGSNWRVKTLVKDVNADLFDGDGNVLLKIKSTSTSDTLALDYVSARVKIL
eukprot:TRINITY_DN5516_c0_g1_i2.p1 TRINITY_DN5516_c0_g1~~TRINITY_DN5516_c0_g1_i2.p1  ORF type:complete len:523 (-),score=112.70 TRINITY_DN5516_c0_g1_i2:260-1828(-)